MIMKIFSIEKEADSWLMSRCHIDVYVSLRSTFMSRFARRFKRGNMPPILSSRCGSVFFQLQNEIEPPLTNPQNPIIL